MNGCLHGLLIVSLAFAATASVDDVEAQTAFLPSVAVNPDQTRAFSAGVDGRLLAIDLADGSVRWRSHRQLEAVGFDKGNVIAWALSESCEHCLHLVWLSAVDGRELRASMAITFPDWVRVEPANGKQFTATIEEDAGSLMLHWNASSRYAGGARPSSEILADFRKDANGTFVIRPQGQVTAAKTQTPAAIPTPVTLREVKTATWRNCSEWHDAPVVAGNGMVAFELATSPKGQTLSARRWRLPSGQLDATRKLAQGSRLELQTSPDARYLFVHDGALQTDVEASTSWQVYSLSTLRPVASIPYLAEQTCANVAADAVVMLIEKSPPPNRGGSQSRELVAYATSNGALRWSVTLRGYPQQAPPR